MTGKPAYQQLDDKNTQIRKLKARIAEEEAKNVEAQKHIKAVRSNQSQTSKQAHAAEKAAKENWKGLRKWNCAYNDAAGKVHQLKKDVENLIRQRDDRSETLIEKLKLAQGVACTNLCNTCYGHHDTCVTLKRAVSAAEEFHFKYRGKVGPEYHQRHCRAAAGYVCACVKAEAVTETVDFGGGKTDG